MSCRANKAVLFAVLLPTLAWAASSEEDLFFKSVADVNEGKLHFLARAPDKAVHHHHNHIFISDTSLTTGWVRLEQCHRHLDPVPSMQVVYSKDRIRSLTISRVERIGRAWVQDNTVQMESVEPDALICIHAESQALRADDEGNFMLANGPYMRRFLDGYYPMRVTMEVTLETDKIQYVDIIPPPQTGFSFRSNGRDLGYEALFEGRLKTVIRFSSNR